MKITFNTTNIPACVLGLLSAQSIGLPALCQATESALNSAVGNVDSAAFGGLRKVKGAKGEHDIFAEITARMPGGVVKSFLVFCADSGRAQKRAEKLGFMLTCPPDMVFPAAFADWIAKFKVVVPVTVKAPKAPKAVTA